jgi:hypothetical protein
MSDETPCKRRRTNPKLMKNLIIYLAGSPLGCGDDSLKDHEFKA